MSAILTSMMKKIIWLDAEQVAVKDALKQLLQGKGWANYSWASLLNMAQQTVLSRDRWRKEASLVPGIFFDSKTRQPRWGSPRDIVFEALLELRLIPEDQRRRDPLPIPKSLRMPSAAALENSPKGNAWSDARKVASGTVTEAEHAKTVDRLMQVEAELANARSKLQNLESERSESLILSRLQALETLVNSLLEFVTSHGYAPRSHSNPRGALGTSFAA
jgi:hypothetical protein